MPSPEKTEKMKNRIDIVSDPLYVVRQGICGERHGPEEWQDHRWKARDATTNVQKRGLTTIAKRWKEDLSYRETQRKHGWTLEYCIFLDYLRTDKIEYKATWEERNRYKNQFVLRWKDEKNKGKMISRDSCLQLAFRNSLGTSGHVLKVHLLKVNHRQCSSEIHRLWHRLLADLRPIDPGNIAERREVLRKEPRNCTIPTPRFARKVFDLESLVSCREDYFLKNCMMEKSQGIRSRTCISVRRPSSRLKYALVQVVLQSQCCGIKKWKWSNQCTIF